MLGKNNNGGNTIKVVDIDGVESILNVKSGSWTTVPDGYFPLVMGATNQGTTLGSTRVDLVCVKSTGNIAQAVQYNGYNARVWTQYHFLPSMFSVENLRTATTVRWGTGDGGRETTDWTNIQVVYTLIAKK